MDNKEDLLVQFIALYVKASSCNIVKPRPFDYWRVQELMLLKS